MWPAEQWGWPLWAVLLGGGAALGIEGLFLAANLTKLVHGAWLPLLIGLTLFTVMTTWQRGRQIVTERREDQEGPLRQFVEELHEQRPPVRRVPGTAIFLNRNKHTAPLAMRANVEHNQVLHERVVIVAVETAPVPVVAAPDIATADDLGYRDDGITLVTLQFGYMQFTNVPSALAALPAEQLESPIDLDARLVLPVHHRPRGRRALQHAAVAHNALPWHLRTGRRCRAGVRAPPRPDCRHRLAHQRVSANGLGSVLSTRTRRLTHARRRPGTDRP